MIARIPSVIRAAALICLYLMLGAVGAASAEVHVVTSVNLPINEIEVRELRSIYKGRLSQVNGHRLTPLNAAPGTTDRDAFLEHIMNANELDYTGYWHVRRYTGQGTPPAEVNNKEELFATLKQKSDAIGYLWVPPGGKPNLPEGLKLIRLK
jgi:ABC-type phosphate transport system substrate-binding protein